MPEDGPESLYSHPPMIVKNLPMNQLEILSRSYHRVVGLRRCFENPHLTPEEALAFCFEEGLVTEDMIASIRRIWIDNEQWVEDVMRTSREGLLEAFHHVRQGGPYLSAWWIQGGGSHYRIAVHPAPEAVYCYVITPHPPTGWNRARGLMDPVYQAYVHAVYTHMRSTVEEG